MNNLEVKKALYEKCLLLVEKRIQTAKKAMDDAQASANEEGKSSAGDKYETGRAMMQIERDKNALQLAEAVKLHQVLKQINPLQPTENIQLGSLVMTNKGQFLMAVSLGKLEHDKQTYFAISLATPLGRKLQRLQKGDAFEFNQQRYQIQEVY